MNTTLRVKFSYCKDGDFGIMPTSEVKFFDVQEFGGKKIVKFKDLEKKQNEYTKFLITAIMEDFPEEKMVQDFLNEVNKVAQGKINETYWDGQSFQHKITRDKVSFEHTIFGICEEYPEWSCHFDEYKAVLELWGEFLEMKPSLRNEVAVEV